MLQIGDPAPDFELLSDENQPIRLSDLRGRRVVLFFFPRADTPGCTAQACGFRDRMPVIETGNATVLGLSPDLPSALAKWRAKEKLPYNLLSDPDHEVADAFGAWGEKSMYGKTYEGIIRSTILIDRQGRIAQVWRNVRVDGHADAVLQAARAL